MRLINQVLNKKPGGNLEAIAQIKLPYLAARQEAQKKFEAGDLAGAAASASQALEKDRFATDAAFQAAISYMLNDRLDDAVKMLHEIRVRGTSEATAKSEKMLKELASVNPSAGQELQAGVPPAPPVEEIFTGVRFGVPDFESGKRFILSSAVDLRKWETQLMERVAALQPAKPATPEAANPPTAAPGASDPSAPAATTVAQAAGAPHSHIEFVPVADRPATPGPEGVRDIVIRRVEPESGFVSLEGPSGEVQVLVGTRVLSNQLPAKFALPAGKYQMRTIFNGRTAEQTIEVKPLATTTIPIGN
jgi:hypothetical protein